ncbi:hypothetical protein GOP47_0024299 [Adiantum capillus-veneris]|uniref:DUF659 domain-containing protein n=1 Tax=Adiantum capillus-veneris TaxID=13818 RepID=A0A9D4U3T1_ADICA|nr:hypothetical protein GOP47_0024299 [Adiantum capillus-veneris]
MKKVNWLLKTLLCLCVEDSNAGDATEASTQDVDTSHAAPSIITTQAAPSQSEVGQLGVGTHKKRARTSGHSSTLHDVWAPSLKKAAEIAEERFFYQCNIAFHAARTGAYKRFVNAVSMGAATGASTTLAGSEALRTSRLTRQVDMVHEQLQGHRDSWAVYGCTIISDGWKDVRKHRLLNILVSCCTGTTFLRAIDLSGAGIRITRELIFQHIRDAIEELINFVHRKSFALGLFTAHCKWALKKPRKTRFCYIFIVLCRLMKCKDDLRRMVVDERWLNWPDSTTPVAVAILDRVICNNTCWREIDCLQAALQPIVSVLRLCDSEGSTLGLLYEFMTKLRVAIRDCTSLSSDRVSIMLDIFDVRWNWFRRPIRCVAHMLHPAWRSGRGNFSRAIAKDVENQALPVSRWEKFGGLTPMLQSLALQVLSQEVSSSGAERLWSIMGDLHTKDRNRLNTPQLDRLAFVNANLRVLEKAGGLDSAGPGSWLPKQVDHRQIVVEAADISHLQPHTPEDVVYDFIREDMMRFSRQTRLTTRCRRGESTIATTSARLERATRARRPRRNVAELTSTTRRLTRTPSECESEEESQSDGSQ